jgi:hypothetical protein
MVSEETKIKAVPVVRFSRYGKIITSHIPLHHQLQITAQRSFKFSFVKEMPKCYFQSYGDHTYREPRERYDSPQPYSVS